LALKYNPITGKLDLVNDSASQSPNYQQTFVAGDFTGPFSGYYQIIVAASTHQKGLHPIVQVFELVGPEYEKVETSVSVDISTGDLKIGVVSSPDARFDGKVIIAENN